MLKVSGLDLNFRNFALQTIDLSIQKGDYFMLVGPTGAGKTLLLETIAGLHNIKGGEIWLEGRNITKLAPEKRNIGMVYQDCALFPHLSVAENIAFGLKIRRFSNKAVKREVEDIVYLVGISHLMKRMPEKLSGGEKQKVALARALTIKPRLLLLDEPLSALDPETREGLQMELRRIHYETNTTVIHVTHNFDEALALGAHIAVIGAGKIMQVGTVEEIFRKPNSEFVAHFTMVRNILTGKLVRRNNGDKIFLSGNLEIVIATDREIASYACIRPDDVIVSPIPLSSNNTNIFTGIIARIENRDMGVKVIVNIPDEICIFLSHHRLEEMKLSVGQNVYINLKPDFIHVF